MTNLPVFFTSVAARAAKEFMILEQTVFFSPCSSAIAAAMAPFPMLLTAFLLPFMAFMAFIGARDFGRAIAMGCRACGKEMSSLHKKLE